MDLLLDLLSWLTIGIGMVFLFAGGIGLLRMPDFYTRCHAAGITDTGAMLLLIVGLMFQAGLSFVTVKLALIMVFLLFTSPTATHALAQAAYTGGMRPESAQDETDPLEEAGS